MADLQLNRRVFGTRVRLTQSGETGVIAAFASYRRDRLPQFLVEYVAADGRATTGWFYKDQLEVVSLDGGEVA